MSEIFEKLLTISWQPEGYPEQVAFPITSLTTELRHDLVEHKYPDINGAHIEDMGTAPLRISAKALFYNGISPGPNEIWTFGKLFPEQYNKFLKASQVKKAGKLIHPILGELKCNLVSANTMLSSDRRDGVAVDMEWLETIEDEFFGVKPVAVSPNLISDSAAVVDLLSQAPVGVQKPSQALVNNTASLTEAIDFITTNINKADLAQRKVVGKIDAVVYHLDKLLDTIERFNSVSLCQLKDKAQKVKSDLRDLKSQVNSSVGTVRYYETAATMTMGQLVVIVKNNIVDLLKLNPNLAGKAVIPAKSIVKFYKA